MGPYSGDARNFLGPERKDILIVSEETNKYAVSVLSHLSLFGPDQGTLPLKAQFPHHLRFLGVIIPGLLRLWYR